jgi:elongation factor G
MIEVVAEADDTLTHKYLEGEALTTAEIRHGLRLGTLQSKFVPVLTGSALKNKGIQPMLDASPTSCPRPRRPADDRARARHDKEVVRTVDDKEPFSGLVFKIATDPFVGHLAFFRVYSGTLKAGSYVLNSTKGKKERGRARARDARQPPRGDREVYAGDIGAIVGPQGHHHRRHAVRPGPPDPARVDELPRAGHRGQDRAQDEGRPGQDGQSPSSAWPRRTRPFRVKTDQESGETLIAGMGELHLDVIVDRMVREFRVAANIGRPQVSYRETIRRPAEGVGRFIRQTGGKGQYGHVVLNLEPELQGRRLRVRRQDRRRHDSARVHARRPAGDHRDARDGRLRRLPDGRRQGDRLRRLVPRGRLVGDGVQDRRLRWRSRTRSRRPARSSSSP